MVRIAKKALGDSGVRVASVATAFPSGQTSRDIKIRDTKYAISEGADEVDMVIVITSYSIHYTKLYDLLF